MGKIFGIFKNDLKTVYTNIIAFIVVIGITILPALYSWFNIASNWDPYSATEGVSFAVVNNDKGYTYQSISVNAGDQIIEGLKTNDKMGWQFVDEKEAMEGVESGRYYAALVIPEKFSENLCSITTGEFIESKLDYYVNEKKNAIAPKITNAGVTTIEAQVKSAYVNTVTNILATMLNITAGELDSKKTDILGSVKEELNDITADIDTFNSSIDVFISTLNLLKQVLSTNKELLPAISETLSDSGVITKDVKSSIDAARSSSSKISSAVSAILDAVSSMQTSVSDKLDEAFDIISTDAAAAADKLISVTDVNRKIISINNFVLSIVNNISSSFDIDLSAVTNRIDQANERQQQITDKLMSAAQTLRTAGTLPAEIKAELKTLADTCKGDITNIETEFTSLRTVLDKTVDDVFSVLENASGLLQTVSGDIPGISKTLDSTSDSIDEMVNTFESVKKTMSQSKVKLSSLIKTVDGLEKGSDLTDLVLKIINDPGALSKFFSEPVTTETHSVHPVMNYGTGMSPFYTSLGIWVGGIILIAIVRVELTEKQIEKLRRPGKTQQFFGRYLIFLLLSLLQAVIISLGDIYFLGIQCNDKFLFVLGCMISAFVYSMIIYSLTITFNVIGKALAVIILVLQVAGSGGTFPLEVLPGPFRDFAKFLPFRYGNDILREAIAGPDMGMYWKNVLLLLAFVPFALVLGLLLRRPCIKLMHFLDKRIHQSELII